MLDQLPGIALTPCTRLAANIHEVVGFIISITHNFGLGVMQERQELAVETFFPFSGQLEVESPHATAENGPQVVHILTRGHPIRLLALLQLYLRAHSTYHRATAS